MDHPDGIDGVPRRQAETAEGWDLDAPLATDEDDGESASG